MPIRPLALSLASAALLTLAAASPAAAHDPAPRGGGQGWGGQGWGGPACPAVACPHYGAGPGAGYGMGPGIMGHGMGYGSGPGMMDHGLGYGGGPDGRGHGYGYGYGPGMMGRGAMRPGMGDGPGANGMAPLSRALEVEDVREMMTQRLAWAGNPNLELGEVTARDDDTIVAEIVTRDGSLVRAFEIDRATGWMRPVR